MESSHFLLIGIVSLIFLLSLLTALVIQFAKDHLTKERGELETLKSLIKELNRRNATAQKDGFEVFKEWELGCKVKWEGRNPFPHLEPHQSGKGVQLLLNIHGGKLDQLDWPSRVAQCLFHRKRHHVPLRSGYVSDRLFTILGAVNDRNIVRKSPNISDLHGVTEQREEAGKAVSFSRSIAPCLLVMGIFGTMLGIHLTLSDPDQIQHLHQNMKPLSMALIPGALAVFMTIILMFLRGSYNTKWYDFISDFDNYTITDLLPFFQPQKISSAAIDQVIEKSNAAVDAINMKAISKALVGCDSFFDMWEALKKFKQNDLEPFEKNLKEVKDISNSVEAISKKLSRNLSANQEFIKQNGSLEPLEQVQRLMDKQHDCWDSVKRMASLRNELTFKRQIEGDLYRKLNASVEDKHSLVTVQKDLEKLSQILAFYENSVKSTELPGDFKSVFSRVMSTKINRAQEIFYGTITGRILLCLIAISYVVWLFS